MGSVQLWTAFPIFWLHHDLILYPFNVRLYITPDPACISMIWFIWALISIWWFYLWQKCNKNKTDKIYSESEHMCVSRYVPSNNTVLLCASVTTQYTIIALIIMPINPDRMVLKEFVLVSNQYTRQSLQVGPVIISRIIRWEDFIDD